MSNSSDHYTSPPGQGGPGRREKSFLVKYGSLAFGVLVLFSHKWPWRRTAKDPTMFLSFLRNQIMKEESSDQEEERHDEDDRFQDATLSGSSALNNLTFQRRFTSPDEQGVHKSIAA